MGKRTDISKQGIELASDYLGRNGVEVIEHEWKCESGIADIIAKENDELAFVKVNTRAGTASRLPENSIPKSVRLKFEQLALNYLSTHNLPSCKVRFDIISILICENQKAFLRHHRDALAAGA